MADPKTSAPAANLAQYAQSALGADYIQKVAGVFGPNAVADLAIITYSDDTGHPAIEQSAKAVLRHDMKTVIDFIKPENRDAFLGAVKEAYGVDATNSLTDYYAAKSPDSQNAASKHFLDLAEADYTKKHDALKPALRKDKTLGIVAQDDKDETLALGATAEVNEAIHNYALLRAGQEPKEAKGKPSAFADLEKSSGKRVEMDLEEHARKVVNGPGPEAKAARDAIIAGNAGPAAAEDMKQINTAHESRQPEGKLTDKLLADEKAFLAQKTAKAAADAVSALGGLGITVKNVTNAATTQPTKIVPDASPAEHIK